MSHPKNVRKFVLKARLSLRQLRITSRCVSACDAYSCEQRDKQTTSRDQLHHRLSWHSMKLLRWVISLKYMEEAGLIWKLFNKRHEKLSLADARALWG